MINNSIVTRFSPGDRVYFPVYSLAEIVSAIVVAVFTDDSAIFYDILEVPSLNEKQSVPENELFTFAEAKTNLVTYLTTQTGKAQEISGI